MARQQMSERHRRLRPIVLRRAGYRCECPGCGRCEGYCQRRATTADHILPRALGGRDELDNYRAACLPCNSSMGASLGNSLRSTHPFFRTTPLPRPAQGNLSPLGEGLPENANTKTRTTLPVSSSGGSER